MKFLLGLLSALPAPVAYALSDVIFFLLFYVFRYRRSVVQENLLHAFPDRTDTERKHIERDSYRHFCDLVTEILRSTKMSQAEFVQRMEYQNIELLAEVTNNFERQAIVLLIHQGNWEWMLHSVMAQLPISVDPVYKSLHSEFWNTFMLEARSRFGATPMTIENVGREVIRGRKRKRLIVMLADQSGPKNGGYWTQFLSRPASFYRGADKLAQTLKIPVVFARCEKRSRGHYSVELSPLSMPPHADSENDILRRYVERAESSIAEQPFSYLWTNRRWKKQPPPGQVIDRADP